MLIKKSLSSLWIISVFASSFAGAEISEPENEVFARVGTSVILVSDYKRALIRSSRNTFYHAKPPEGELLAFQQKVADQIIDRELLLQQAAQSGLHLDDTQLEKELDKYRQRALRRGEALDEESVPWQLLRQRIESDLLAKELENKFKQDINAPSEEALRAYYQAHLENFTEPARFDLSTILLGVAPSAGGESWEAARQEANDLVTRLRAGDDFGELARIHSSDVSAADGGELGYSHKGMFSAPAQEVIEQLQPGEISDALQVLEGIVIFRLNGVQVPRLMEFSQVRGRVQDLWLRDERQSHWEKYLADLRNNTSIEITEKYLTLSGQDSDISKISDEN